MQDVESKVPAQAALLGSSHACPLGVDVTLGAEFLELQPEVMCCEAS